MGPTTRIASSGALALFVCVFASIGTHPAVAAIVVDGQLDAEYGSATIVQTLQTGLSSGGQIPGDNTLGDLNFASGSELDAAYALVSGGTLRLFLSGNLALRLTMQQNDTRGHVLDVFVDCAPGGQNQLNGLGTGYPLNGMTLETGFAADYWFEFFGQGDQFAIDWYASRGVIDSPGSGTLTLLGRSSAGGPGTLIGGTNPFGVKATIDNRNTGGVTFGCNASSGAGVTRGIEWEIPLTAIGSPTGCFRLMAIVRDGSAVSSPLSNSSLAPMPAGTCPPGSAQFVNFASIAGDQSFEACPSPIGVPAPASAALSLALAGPNPARGDGVAFRVALPDESAATLELIDLRGRVVRRRTVDAQDGVVDLSAGARLAPGLYWARLSHPRGSTVRRICIAS
jgi:hypothetical protein